MTRRSESMMAAVFLGVLLTAMGCLAQQDDYVIGTGDVLALNVLSRPDWDRTLVVRGDGTVTVPQVGVIMVRGLSAAEARDVVARKFRLFDPTIGEIVLAVEEYNSLRVYVLGAVVAPGPYSFESAPTAWEAVRAAGGALDSAVLAGVRVVPESGAVRYYDLSIPATGVNVGQQRLMAGDTVIVPAQDSGVFVDPAQGVQVFGHVGQPSIIPLHEPSRLLTVLMLAGTPLTTSRLDNVAWVHGEIDGSVRATSVNLDRYIEEGNLAGNPLIYPGDTVRIDGIRESWLRRNLPLLLGVVTSTATVWLAVDRTQN